MTGTAAMSGSEPSRRRKRVIAATPSSIASSMLTSRITAPLATWSRAIADRLVLGLGRGAVGRALAVDAEHQAGELARAGDVGPLADVDERPAGHRDHERLEAREPGRVGRAAGRRAAATPATAADDGRGVLGRAPAARPGEVDQARARPLAQRRGGLVRASRRSRRARSGGRRSGTRRAARRRAGSSPRRARAAASPRARSSGRRASGSRAGCSSRTPPASDRTASGPRRRRSSR